MTKSTMKKDLHDTRVNLRSQLKKISLRIDDLDDLDFLKELLTEFTSLDKKLVEEQIKDLEKRKELLSSEL